VITGPVSPDPGRDEGPTGPAGGPGETLEGWRELPPSHEDWLTEEEWAAQASWDEEEWFFPGEDPGDDPGSGDSGSISSGGSGGSGSGGSGSGGSSARGSARAVKGSRRGPGQPGSARRVADASCGPAGAFATGHTLDVAPGGAALLGLAEYAAGDGDRFAGANEDELMGVICALDRCEASASALKHAAVAELIRRRPRSQDEPVLSVPGDWEEFTATELSYALADTRPTAEGMLDLASALAVKLPGTSAAFRTGELRLSKVYTIVASVTVLDAEEARAAEARVLERAGRLTPSGLRSAIGRAVIEVAPDKAAKRRKDAERNARVERWPEHSGNGGLAGRELPPADVFAADQRISWWAKQLKKAGLEGDMDLLRARAFMDLLLARDSRTGVVGTVGGGSDLPPTASVIPAGFAGHMNLTTPLATLVDRAERPGEIGGIGPIDPELARELARAAAANPKTTWCVTVTDKQGHAIGHGCARPEPKKRTRSDGRPRTRPPPAGAQPVEFTFTATGEPGPPGGYGSWRLSTGGQGAMLIEIHPIALDECDHRFEARGHDPGVKLRHLTQIRHATCVGPTCRRPAGNCDFEHNIPYQAGGRTCLCNGGPVCRHDHRLKQHPRWKVEQITPGTFRWTTPSGRTYMTEPTRYPT
jgi:hypothetical protein